MTQTITIPANETGVIRVVALSMSDAEAKALKKDRAALIAALGLDIDPDQTEIFPLADLDGLGLAGYLHEGNAVPLAQLSPDKAKLEALDGWVLIVFSRAFQGGAATLTPAPALTLIGTYSETGTDWRATEIIEADSAKPYSAPTETTKKRPSDAAMSGRVATLVLILLALFTYVFIKVAG